MSKTSEEKEFTTNGLTFTVLEGGKENAQPKTFESEIEKIYGCLLNAFAKSAEASPEAVQDVLHDVLLQELERVRRGFRRSGIKNLLGYLKKAALRELWRVRREEKRFVPFSRLGDETLQMFLEAPSREPDPLVALIAREMELLATERLERLPLRQRHVLALWCSGLEISEIALKAATTPGNVRFHKHAAIKSLKEAFGMVREETT